MVNIDEYTSGVVKRTKDARKQSKYKTQADIAAALKIERARYAKYETERIIGKELISIFCRLAGVNEKWLLTGQGPMTGDDAADPLEALLDMYELPQSRARVADMIKELERIRDAEKVIKGE